MARTRKTVKASPELMKALDILTKPKRPRTARSHETYMPEPDVDVDDLNEQIRELRGDLRAANEDLERAYKLRDEVLEAVNTLVKNAPIIEELRDEIKSIRQDVRSLEDDRDYGLHRIR
jgi:uncharacterized coiled-coil DUF342 family protein